MKRPRPIMAKVRTPPIYTTPTDAALAFYQAFEAKDVDAMMTTWAEDEEIVCVHPGGTLCPSLPQVPMPLSISMSLPTIDTRVRASGPLPISVAPLTG